MRSPSQSTLDRRSSAVLVVVVVVERANTNNKPALFQQQGLGQSKWIGNDELGREQWKEQRRREGGREIFPGLIICETINRKEEHFRGCFGFGRINKGPSGGARVEFDGLALTEQQQQQVDNRRESKHVTRRAEWFSRKGSSSWLMQTFNYRNALDFGHKRDSDWSLLWRKRGGWGRQWANRTIPGTMRPIWDFLFLLLLLSFLLFCNIYQSQSISANYSSSTDRRRRRVCCLCKFSSIRISPDWHDWRRNFVHEEEEEGQIWKPKKWKPICSDHTFSPYCIVLLAGVTILLSLTVFLNLVAETLPQVSDAIPLLG